MDNHKLKVGILFSLTGTTSITERGFYQASLLAIRHINENGGINGKILVPVVEDVESDPFIASRKAEKLILTDQVIAIIGLYSTGCRKKVIPILEKHNVLLFYPTFYEGSEQHPNIVYCGSLPNQQLLDFIPWLMQNIGKSFYLLGSDYIYPRETNRYIRALVKANGGGIQGEQYFELGDKNFSKVLSDIRRMNPDVIFSTLIGESGISFYQQHKKHGLIHSIASTITAETEIEAISKGERLDYYSCFPYFSSINSERNKKFVSEYREAFGIDNISSVMENTYNSVFLLADALKKTDTISTESIRNALSGLSLETPQGKIIFDSTSQHLCLHSRIGKVNERGRFDILWESESPIAPIPYLEFPFHEHDVHNGYHVQKKSINSQITRHKSLISGLKKALATEPYQFGYFDEEGMLIEIFSSVNSRVCSPLNDLTIGDKCHRGPLAKSGIGLALQKSQYSYEVTRELNTEDSKSWITVAGFPIIGNSGERRGVLGVFIPDSVVESIEAILSSIANSVYLCAKIEDIEEEHRKISDVLLGIADQLSDSLIVIKDGKIHYQNQPALELLKRKKDLIDSLFRELNSEQEENVRTIRRVEQGETYEIKIIYKNSMYFIYLKTLYSKINRLSLEKRGNLTTNDLVGSNESFLHTVNLARIAARTRANVLLLGESGTGKEMFARAIHNESTRKDKPFIALNCASISKELINAELFGYVDGAFTGAKKGGSPGKFEIANGGTLFLDEIGDMPFDIQATLLRVLQEREVVRIGGHKSIPVDVRIIAATNKELSQEIAYKGSFRSDLYYRLNVFTIELLPIRNRIEDIESLSSYYLAKLSDETGQREKKLSVEAITLLRKYIWPGNIRELNNVIERAFYLSDNSPILEPEHLPEYITQYHCLTNLNNQDLITEAPTLVSDIKMIKQQANEKESGLYIDALIKHNGNISKTAKYLGISRTTLYRKLKEHSIKT